MRSARPAPADLHDGPDRRTLSDSLIAQRHMVRAAVNIVHDQRHLVAQLVGEPLRRHAERPIAVDRWLVVMPASGKGGSGKRC